MTTHLETRNVWLVRHGNRLDFTNPDWLATAEQPFDPPLSPDGYIQARDVGRRLAGESVRHIFCSPFLRAVETACGIATHLDLPVHVEIGLSEWLRAEWFPSRPKLPSTETLRERFPQLAAHHPSAVPLVYPETEQEMRVRTARVIQGLLERFEGDLLLVCHGASLIGIAHALVKSGPPISTPVACLVQVSRREGEWMLVRNGSDISHLTIPYATPRLA